MRREKDGGGDEDEEAVVVGVESDAKSTFSQDRTDRCKIILIPTCGQNRE